MTKKAIKTILATANINSNKLKFPITNSFYYLKIKSMTKKHLSKKTILTGFACMLVFAMSLIASKKAYAMNGMGCYNPQVYTCPLGFQRQGCNFTGVYGAPYNCAEWSCLWEYQERHCVPSAS